MECLFAGPKDHILALQNHSRCNFWYGTGFTQIWSQRFFRKTCQTGKNQRWPDEVFRVRWLASACALSVPVAMRVVDVHKIIGFISADIHKIKFNFNVRRTFLF